MLHEYQNDASLLRMIDERSCPLRYVPSARFRSSIFKDIFSIAWTIRFNDDLMLVISPSTTPTLVERLGGSSSSLATVEKFAETMKPLDTGSEEDE